MANNVKIPAIISAKSCHQHLDFVAKFLPTDMHGQPCDKVIS